MAHLIVQDVTISEMMDSTLIVINHVDSAHCADFSISNPDVIIVKKELILAKEIAKSELLNVKNVVNKDSKYTVIPGATSIPVSRVLRYHVICLGIMSSLILYP